MRTIEILLADDHQLVRQGLRALLSAEHDLSIVGEAGDGVTTLRLVNQLKPDVAVVDVMMPAINGLEVTRQIARRSRKTRVVILSMHANEGYVIEALQNGAAAYILKESTSAELVKAIREVAAGRRFLGAPFSKTSIQAYLEKAKGAPADRYDTLTTREREIFLLVAEGRSNAEIGRKLFISERTVELHRAHMMGKLGLRSHAEVVRYAIGRGIVPLDPPPGA